jgi:beta-lactamase class A
MPRRLLTRTLLAVLLAVLLAGGALAGATSAAAAPQQSRTHCSTRLSARLATFAHAHRGVTLAVAVRDLTNGAGYGYRRHTRQRTASIVKVEILQALLHRYPRGLPSGLAAVATRMIERSDNVAAEQLYRRVGRAAGLRRFGRLAGLRETDPAAAIGPGYAWGLTLTSPSDQLRLLQLLTRRNTLLTDANRRFALRLMRHVVTAQRWGVTSGAGDSRVALKNGWLPLRDWSSNWQINSIGVVHGRVRNYLVAIESHGADTMGHGVALVDEVSRLVARACG